MKKKIVIGSLVVVLICAIGFGLYSLYNRNGENGQVIDENGPVVDNGEQEPVTPESQMIDVEEEYYDSVNADITLEQLQNSKLVYQGVQILNEGSPFATAYIFIFRAKVVNIDGRTLDLAKESDKLSIFIGENVDISIAKGVSVKEGKFEEIKINGFVSIGARLQYARGDPLRLSYLTFYQN